MTHRMNDYDLIDGVPYTPYYVLISKCYGDLSQPRRYVLPRVKTRQDSTCSFYPYTVSPLQ